MTAPTITWASVAAANLSDPDARFDNLTDALDRHPGYYDPIPLRLFASLATTSGFDLAAVLWYASPAEAARRISAEISLAVAHHILPHVSPDERLAANKAIKAARAYVDTPGDPSRFNVHRSIVELKSRAGRVAILAAWHAISDGVYCGAGDTMTAAIAALRTRGSHPKAEIGAIALRAAIETITYLERTP